MGPGVIQLFEFGTIYAGKGTTEDEQQTGDELLRSLGSNPLILSNKRGIEIEQLVQYTGPPWTD